MKRTLISVALLAAGPLFAQPTAAPASTSTGAELVVAKINGETITRAKLDQLWSRIGARSQQQYEKSGGGKAGFLNNYVSKRLVLQKAIADGFEKKPTVQAEVDAAKEAALFDFYLREVVASQIVTEEQIRKFYDENPTQFSVGERRYLRYLLISTKGRSVEQAREILSPIFGELFGELTKTKGANLPSEEFGRKFSEYARKFSEDVPTVASGGEIGWFEKSQLDPKVADTVFEMPEGSMTGMLPSDVGLQLLYIERVRAPEKETFEQARASIREYLLGTNMNKVVEAVNKMTTELRSSGKVVMFPENVH